MVRKVTVAQYVQHRFQQLGITHMFGIAGNYTAPLLDTILADEASTISIIRNATEITAGFAADAFARYKSPSAVYVTYGVGSFSAVNAIAGSYTEQVPVVLVNGSPTTKEDVTEEHDGVISLHSTGSRIADIEVFRPITAAAVRVTNATQAPFQIDSVLTVMLTSSRAVYLEVQEDVWRAECAEPSRTLQPAVDAIITVSNVQKAVDATMDMIKRRSKLMFWAGIELLRFKLQGKFEHLLKAANAKCSGEKVEYVTSVASKSILAESSEYYGGTYKFTAEEIVSLVGDDGIFLALGSWITSFAVGSTSPRGDGRIFVGDGYALVGDQFFASVSLEEYMVHLSSALFAAILSGIPLSIATATDKASQRSKTCENGIGYDEFLKAIGGWLQSDDILIVDAGLALNGSPTIPIKSAGGFLAQASWLSIGYSVPAATGVKCAMPDKRVVVVSGDGAFHENFQGISDQVSLKQNNVIFVLVNGLYGIEQYIANPNPFRQPPAKYKEPIFNKAFPYNHVARWDYTKIPAMFGGGVGLKASNSKELDGCLRRIREEPDMNFVVEITVPPTDTPSAVSLERKDPGEDEIPNPYWPPASVY